MASTSSTTLDVSNAEREGDLAIDGKVNEEKGEDYVKKCLKDADEIKKEGTEYFKAGNWKQAIATYTSALALLPERPPPPMPKENPEDVDENDPAELSRAEEKKPASPEPVVATLEGLDLEYAKARSVLNANIGACHVKLEEYKEAIAACTEALADDPTYVKALQRRAACNEQLGTWSSLTAAQEDYNNLLKILPPDSPQIAPTKRALLSLKPRLEEAQKKETAEMLDKLKGFGNSILGRFGLSTDNFKFDPNGDGGYSLNFVK